MFAGCQALDVVPGDISEERTQKVPILRMLILWLDETENKCPRKMQTSDMNCAKS